MRCFRKRTVEKIEEARKRKARRLKQAKDDAIEEIEKYRQERENQAKHIESREEVAAKMEADTRDQLADIDRSLASHKEPVIQELLQYMYNIVPKMHKNYKKN
uniref:V-type proton ATPase subunit G n=1 Tax=Megaselia scalaris TaxID=36166 RepID=T1GT07_MEGSC